MFGFLKKKLNTAISKFSEKVEEEAEKPVEEEKEVEVSKEDVKEEVSEIKEEIKVEEPYTEPEQVVEEIKEEELKEEPVIEVPKAEIKEEPEPEVEKKEGPVEEKKQGFFGRIKKAVTGTVTDTKISEEKFEKLFWDLEVMLLENNVAVEVIEKIKTDLKKELVDKPISRGKVEKKLRETLKNSIEGLFTETYDLNRKIKEEKPFKIMFVGINGSGKTTTIAKITKMLLDKELKVVLAAADTFRAAAIHQLQEHADKLGVKLIKHDYGSDPAAVAFDAIKYAEANDMDVVLIDTAGRLHSNVNLIDELKKITRVAKPDLKIFVGESTTGNDCVEQSKKFNEAIGIDGVILAKADIDEKGGAAISVSYVTQKPILFLGTGQEYGDLTPFKSEVVVESLGLTS
jgi:fused signal recognition particle receptor